MEASWAFLWPLGRFWRAVAWGPGKKEFAAGLPRAGGAETVVAAAGAFVVFLLIVFASFVYPYLFLAYSYDCEYSYDGKREEIAVLIIKLGRSGF